MSPADDIGNSRYTITNRQQGKMLLGDTTIVYADKNNTIWVERELSFNMKSGHGASQ